ncbi:MAG: hypothetical protein ACOC1F_11835 [Myxococcota bacterium]
MRTSHYVLIGAMLMVGCNGCKKEEDDPPPMPAAPTTSTPPPEPAVLTTAEPAAPGEVVRPELDNREDGGTGATLSVSGAKAIVKVPTDWKKKTEDKVTVATAPDEKSRLAVMSGDDPLQEMDKLAEKAAVSSCEWGTPLTLTVGKDKLSAQAADGKCGGKPAAYMATEDLITLASWDEGSDRNALFGILRSVAKRPTGKGGVSRLVACCRVLAQNAKSQPPPQSGFMMQAAATCEAAARNNNVAAVNAALSQFGMKCN